MNGTYCTYPSLIERYRFELNCDSTVDTVVFYYIKQVTKISMPRVWSIKIYIYTMLSYLKILIPYDVEISTNVAFYRSTKIVPFLYM